VNTRRKNKNSNTIEDIFLSFCREFCKVHEKFNISEKRKVEKQFFHFRSLSPASTILAGPLELRIFHEFQESQIGVGAGGPAPCKPKKFADL
jgi:hypothetical protein